MLLAWRDRCGRLVDGDSVARSAASLDSRYVPVEEVDARAAQDWRAVGTWNVWVDEEEGVGL